MIERLYILEDVDPGLFFGLNKANLALLSNLHPKLRLTAHGNVLKVLGEDKETEPFLEHMAELESFAAEYNSLTEEDIIRVVKGRKTEAKQAPRDLILYGITGRPIVARGPNQQRFVKAFEENDLAFAVGPAGSGKTYVAIALAVRALKAKQVRRIILSRPAVEAGEKLGFLPGELKEKLDPYLQPLYDALGEMIPAVKLREYVEGGVIQIAPLAYMRGRTLNDAVVILDEAQNTTVLQMKMFLTRLGHGAKMIVTGDTTQIDLPYGSRSGLTEALALLGNLRGISHVEFDKKDIVRHPLVERIVDAYDKDDERKRKLKAQEDKESDKPKNNIEKQ